MAQADIVNTIITVCTEYPSKLDSWRVNQSESLAFYTKVILCDFHLVVLK